MKLISKGQLQLRLISSLRNQTYPNEFHNCFVRIRIVVVFVCEIHTHITHNSRGRVVSNEYKVIRQTPIIIIINSSIKRHDAKTARKTISPSSTVDRNGRIFVGVVVWVVFVGFIAVVSCVLAVLRYCRGRKTRKLAKDGQCDECHRIGAGASAVRFWPKRRRFHHDLCLSAGDPADGLRAARVGLCVSAERGQHDAAERGGHRPGGNLVLVLWIRVYAWPQWLAAAESVHRAGGLLCRCVPRGPAAGAGHGDLSLPDDLFGVLHDDRGRSGRGKVFGAFQFTVNEFEYLKCAILGWDKFLLS